MLIYHRISANKIVRKCIPGIPKVAPITGAILQVAYDMLIMPLSYWEVCQSHVRGYPQSHTRNAGGTPRRIFFWKFFNGWWIRETHNQE